jgi:hypothetical protein
MLKSLHRSLECITLAKEINKLKHKTMKTIKLNKSEIKFYNQLLLQHLTEQDLTKQQIKKQFNKLKK